MTTLCYEKRQGAHLKDFLADTKLKIDSTLSSEKEVLITDTKIVPSVDDFALTYGDGEDQVLGCKRLKSCILFVDLRESTSISASHRPETLAKLYSAFIKAMAKAAGYFDGKVRGIHGDRVMVVFDEEKCFTNAMNTAVLMNTIATRLIDTKFRNDIKCGIGIDYGEMLVTKVGVVKHLGENSSHKSLTWLGRPANVASKLTDKANKTITSTKMIIHQGNFPLLDGLNWSKVEVDTFLDSLKTSLGTIKHTDPNFCSFFKGIDTTSNTTPPILFTDAVYQGFKKENPDAVSIKNGWWSLQSVSLSQYADLKIYGGDVYKLSVNEVTKSQTAILGLR